LKEAMRFTGAKSKKDAIVQALQDFNRRRRVAELVKHFGTFTSIMTNEEIETKQLRDQLKRLHAPD